MFVHRLVGAVAVGAAIVLGVVLMRSLSPPPVADVPNIQLERTPPPTAQTPVPPTSPPTTTSPPAPPPTPPAPAPAPAPAPTARAAPPTVDPRPPPPSRSPQTTIADDDGLGDSDDDRGDD